MHRALLLLGLLVLAPTPAWSQRPGPGVPGGASVPMLYRNAEIAEVLRRTATATGESFLFDDQLRGRITIIVPGNVSREEALALLDAALLATGFAALPTPGGPRKVVPIAEAAAAAPWRLGALGDADLPVATLVRLERADMARVIETLRPMTAADALVLPYPATDSVILAGSERLLHRLLTLIQALDEASDAELVVLRLRHHDAAEMKSIVEDVFGPATEGDGLRIWTDVRSNALIFRASADETAELRALVARLDVPAEGRGAVRVIRVLYVDPDRLAETLDRLAAGGPTTTRAADEEGEAAAALQGRSFTVSVHRPTRSLLVRADPQTHGIVADVVDALDRRPPQVGLEVLAFELTTDSSLELGVDAFLPLHEPKDPSDLIVSAFSNPRGGGLLQPGGGQPVSFAARFTRAPLLFPVTDAMGNTVTLIVPRESVVATADDREVRTRVLLRPHLVVTSGEEQELFAGTNIPIPVAPVQEEGIGTVPRLTLQQNVERQDVGARVRVRPTAGEAGDVRLELDLEFTQLVAPLAGDVEQVGPTISNRELRTVLRLVDGEFAVIGLAPATESSRVERGVPFLKDVPLLGWLFRNEEDMILQRQLVLAVQAWIHRSPEALLADSIRQRLGFERSLARLHDLQSASEVGYAVLVTTVDTEAEARSVADALATSDGATAQVSGWAWGGRQHFDVYLTGFESLAEAGTQANRLLAEGWLPKVTALPRREP